MSDPTPPGSRAGDVSPLQALRDLLPALRGASRRAAEHVLASPAEAGRGSITRLAEASGVSTATLTRLSTQLGFDGFPALRAAIATEHGREVQGGWAQDIGTEIVPSDPPEAVLNVLVANHARAARSILGALDLDAIARVADWVATAARVHLQGDWGDGVALHELSLRLLRIGRPVWRHEGGQSSQVGAGLVRAGDVALVLSRSGVSDTGRAFLATARGHGAHTVVITGAPESDLAQDAEVALFTGTREGEAWTDYFAGRASDTLTTALLWVLVAQRVSDAPDNPFDPGRTSPR